jgi:hypothetical protein
MRLQGNTLGCRVRYPERKTSYTVCANTGFNVHRPTLALRCAGPTSPSAPRPPSSSAEGHDTRPDTEFKLKRCEGGSTAITAKTLSRWSEARGYFRPSDWSIACHSIATSLPQHCRLAPNTATQSLPTLPHGGQGSTARPAPTRRNALPCRAPAVHATAPGGISHAVSRT